MANSQIKPNIDVTFRHTEPTEALKSHAAEKITSCLARYSIENADVHIILLVEKRDHIAEINILGGANVTAKAVKNDLYASIDEAVNHIDRQLRRQKEKIKANRHPHGAAGA